jgi:hypothetical protein
MAGQQRRLAARALRDGHGEARRSPGSAIHAHAAVELNDADAVRPAFGQRLRDSCERSPPAHAERARNRPEGREMVGRRLCDALENRVLLVGNGDDHGIRETEPLCDFTLETETPGARMHDLDADDALLARLCVESSDLPPGHLEEGADLILRLGLVVVELGDSHGEQIVIHGILHSTHQRTREHAAAHPCAHMSSNASRPAHARETPRPPPVVGAPAQPRGWRGASATRGGLGEKAQARLRVVSTWSTTP